MYALVSWLLATSVWELIGTLYISFCRSAEPSFKIGLLYEDICDAYMQEPSAIVLYAVIFVPSRFLLAFLLQCLSGILIMQ